MSIDPTSASVSSPGDAELLDALRHKEIQRRWYGARLRSIAETEARGIRSVRHTARGRTGPPVLRRVRRVGRHERKEARHVT